MTTYTVIAQHDDGAEYGDGTKNAHEQYNPCWSHTTPTSASYRCFGVRFQNIAIAHGDIIDSANLRIRCYENTGFDDINGTIFGNDADNAVDFNTDSNIISRVRTLGIDWIQNNLGWADYVPSPDIAAIIQTIVDRSSWVSGNSIVILLIAKTNFVKACSNYTYDTTPAKAAKLDITSHTPTAPSAAGGAGGGAMMFFRDDIIPRVSEAVVKKAAFLCFDALLAFLLDED